MIHLVVQSLLAFLFALMPFFVILRIKQLHTALFDESCFLSLANLTGSSGLLKAMSIYLHVGLARIIVLSITTLLYVVPGIPHEITIYSPVRFDQFKSMVDTDVKSDSDWRLQLLTAVATVPMLVFMCQL